MARPIHGIEIAWYGLNNDVKSYLKTFDCSSSFWLALHMARGFNKLKRRYR
jgi:hypothetical protein